MLLCMIKKINATTKGAYFTLFIWVCTRPFPDLESDDGLAIDKSSLEKI